ncbi:chromosome segregation protein [Sphingomonas kaistensis]|uniref:Chromosome partition protein Smc n=1 Tax=Sphingomonas kaistensis TaxID=298708 RepID=A0A7X5Y7C2_9SPHN|nr:AAA family ATPase [Sphingomonas kaistensis]NJC05230.1 chromosome segregation protein [Sphingomonas kaistensis]
MRFRRLSLTGFKSFVEPAELRIEPGLTGVVGPNGCGKSNLLEALRWVMGEGSPKSLRGGGMEDVIFAGTASRPARDFAEVSLLLDRGPEGEAEVTRRIERGAGSAYRVDGRDVRQKDVALLFADAATGAHSPALVSQGRIGAMIAARPAERRQMLEEAAGIAGLHVRRKDAETRLRATEANLQRLDELLGDQEQRVAALKRQARAAERYRALTERIRLAEGRLLYSRWKEADSAAVAAGKEADAAMAEVASLTRALEQAQAAQASAVALVADRRQAAARAREEGQTLAHKLATARAALDTARRRLVELGRLSAQLGEERDREIALAVDADNAIATLTAEMEAIAARLADGESRQSALVIALSRAEEDNRASEAALAGLLTREAALRAERQVAGAALNAARSHLQRLTQERDSLDRSLAALGSDDALAAALSAARSATAAAAVAGTAAEQAIAAAEHERGEAAAAREETDLAMAQARTAHGAAASEAAALDKALVASPGRGVLASLTVAAGYEKALAAALGDDLGAPLGKDGDRGWTGAEPHPGDPQLPPGISPLSDQVDAPPELARRLQQVGIVEVDEGQPLQAGQRLVTRSGEVRRWDGFVSKGSGAATAERLARVNRLATLRRELPALVIALEAATAAQAEAATRVAAAGRAVDTARAALATAEATLRQRRRDEDGAAAAAERQGQQRGALTARMEELAPVLAAATAAVRDAEATLGALPAEDLLADEVGEARTRAAEQGRLLAERRADLATAARAAATDRERQLAAAGEQAAWRERAGAAARRTEDVAGRAKRIASERSALEPEPERLTADVARTERAVAGSSALLGAALNAEREAEQVVAEAGAALARANEAMADARERRAAAAARSEAQVARRIEYGRVSGEKFECPPPLLPQRLGFDADDLAAASDESAALERATADRERIGPVNLVAEQELAELEESRLQGAAERDELHEAINRLRGSIGSLNREGRLRLLSAFEAVDRHFRSLFTTLFNGGQAHLALIDSDDPLEAGLEIMAQPPGKKLSSLSLLSGGEQALTAVALIFALFLTRPSPICVLDEVDAPLDDANVERFCDLLVRMTAETDTRYLIVTHNAVTMSRMHRLFGVTMVEQGVSRIVSVDLGAAEELLAAE